MGAKSLFVQVPGASSSTTDPLFWYFLFEYDLYRIYSVPMRLSVQNKMKPALEKE